MRVRALLVLLIAALAAAAATPAYANPQQAGVQVALRALGLYSGPIDGEIGPQTVAAIRLAQQRLHLRVTGIVDAKTRVALGPLGHPLFGVRALRAGDFGLDVSVLQYLLASRGLYHGALDGYLGERTVVALRVYQKRAGLKPDGVLGATTQALLAKQTGIPVSAKPIVHRKSRYTATYVVRAGDSLSAIAERYKLSVGALARANKLSAARVLLIGARLKVPAPPKVAVAVLKLPAAAPAAAGQVRDALDAWAARAGVSQSLVRALAWMESGYQPKTVSSAGAQGVMQTLPSTRQFVEEVLVGKPIPHTVSGDVQVGVLYLRHLLKEFNGDQRLALAAWYQGDTAVRRDGVLAVSKTFVDDVLALAERM